MMHFENLTFGVIMS